MATRGKARPIGSERLPKTRAWYDDAHRLADLATRLPHDLKPTAFALLKRGGFTDRPIRKDEFAAELLRFDRATLLQWEYAIEFLREKGRLP